MEEFKPETLFIELLIKYSELVDAFAIDKLFNVCSTVYLSNAGLNVTMKLLIEVFTVDKLLIEVLIRDTFCTD